MLEGKLYKSTICQPENYFGFLYKKREGENQEKTGHFQKCVNDIPLVQWFRQKTHKWRNGLVVTAPKQANGLKI